MIVSIETNTLNIHCTLGKVKSKIKSALSVCYDYIWKQSQEHLNCLHEAADKSFYQFLKHYMRGSNNLEKPHQDLKKCIYLHKSYTMLNDNFCEYFEGTINFLLCWISSARKGLLLVFLPYQALIRDGLEM